MQRLATLQIAFVEGRGLGTHSGAQQRKSDHSQRITGRSGHRPAAGRREEIRNRFRIPCTPVVGENGCSDGRQQTRRPLRVGCDRSRKRSVVHGVTGNRLQHQQQRLRTSLGGTQLEYATRCLLRGDEVTVRGACISQRVPARKMMLRQRDRRFPGSDRVGRVAELPGDLADVKARFDAGSHLVQRPAIAE